MQYDGFIVNGERWRSNKVHGPNAVKDKQGGLGQIDQGVSVYAIGDPNRPQKARVHEEVDGDNID